jgi:hypothetical protein
LEYLIVTDGAVFQRTSEAIPKGDSARPAPKSVIPSLPAAGWRSEESLLQPLPQKNGSETADLTLFAMRTSVNANSVCVVVSELAGIARGSARQPLLGEL